HMHHLFFIFLTLRPHPTRSTLFPYTTLFRSGREAGFSKCYRLSRTARIATAPGGGTRTRPRRGRPRRRCGTAGRSAAPGPSSAPDRKSTRLNSSHLGISYAVFCLKKKKQPTT